MMEGHLNISCVNMWLERWALCFIWPWIPREMTPYVTFLSTSPSFSSEFPLRAKFAPRSSFLIPGFPLTVNFLFTRISLRIGFTFSATAPLAPYFASNVKFLFPWAWNRSEAKTYYTYFLLFWRFEYVYREFRFSSKENSLFITAGKKRKIQITYNLNVIAWNWKKKKNVRRKEENVEMYEK